MNKSKQTPRPVRRAIKTDDDALNDSLTKWFVRGDVRAHPKFENLLSSNTPTGDDACFRGAYHIMKMIDNVPSESSLIQHLVPGFTGIVAEGGAGKTTVAKAIFEVLSSSDKGDLDVDVSYLSMGEPESSVSYSMEALLDLIYAKAVADPSTLNVVIVDSLKNFWSDPVLNVSGATASGAVNTASYQALSELTTLCLDANVMVIAVLNPLFVKLEDVVKAITSSLSAVWRITTNPGASDLTINGLSRVPIYDKRRWTSVDKMLAPSLLVTRRTAFSFSLVNPVRSADEESHWEREILSWFPGSVGDKPFGG